MSSSSPATAPRRPTRSSSHRSRRTSRSRSASISSLAPAPSSGPQREQVYRDDVRLVTDFAAAHGLTVVAAEPARRLVQLSGPASRMQEAFRTSLYQYADADRHFRGRSGALQLPQELANVVESVLGLDTRAIARSRLMARPATATEAGHLPSQFATLYDFPPGLNGSGPTIALIELGGAVKESARWQRIPQPTVRRVSTR